MDVAKTDDNLLNRLCRRVSTLQQEEPAAVSVPAQPEGVRLRHTQVAVLGIVQEAARLRSPPLRSGRSGNKL